MMNLRASKVHELGIHSNFNSFFSGSDGSMERYSVASALDSLLDAVRSEVLSNVVELMEDGDMFCAVLGQITALGECFVDVACVTGKLRIYEVEINGQFNAPRTWIKSTRQRLT
jgi:hypothetical protein